MRSASALRSQIEVALADRIPSALTPVAKTIREVMPTGIAAMDALLDGGMPVGAVTEMIGAECSGRTTLALSFVAQVTRAERVCAWIDVSNTLSPESGPRLSTRVRLRMMPSSCRRNILRRLSPEKDCTAAALARIPAWR
jgi:RecA/RadA recombinase